MSAINASTGSTGSTAQGFSALSSDEFMKIIFAELSSQDPLQPNDTTTLLNQLSDIRSIQSDVDLQERLSSLVDQSQLSSAAGLIGKYISGVSEAQRRVIGQVIGVSRTASGAVLTLDSGARVPMQDVDEIVNPQGDTGSNGDDSASEEA